MKKENMKENGVFIKSFFKVRDLRKRIQHAMRNSVAKNVGSGSREDVLKSICSGLVSSVYVREGNRFSDGDKDLIRSLCRESVLGYSQKWIVGVPWDLDLGYKVLSLIRSATAIQPEWLLEIAPHMVRIQSGVNADGQAVEMKIFGDPGLTLPN